MRFVKRSQLTQMLTGWACFSDFQLNSLPNLCFMLQLAQSVLDQARGAQSESFTHVAYSCMFVFEYVMLIAKIGEIHIIKLSFCASNISSMLDVYQDNLCCSPALGALRPCLNARQGMVIHLITQTSGKNGDNFIYSAFQKVVLAGLSLFHRGR